MKSFLTLATVLLGIGSFASGYGGGLPPTPPEYRPSFHNIMFQVAGYNGTFYADSYDNYCAFRNNRDADRFRRTQYRNGRIVSLYTMPYLRYTGTCLVY